MKTSLAMTESSNRAEETPSLLLSKLNAITLEGPTKLILASQSPRRREILDMMGLRGRYTVQFSPLNEEALQEELAEKDLTPQEYTSILAQEKAKALAEALVGDDYSPDDTIYILGSDTIVDYDVHILNKPQNETQAIEMLSQLSGNYHYVHTGVAIYKLEASNTEISSVTLADSFVETAKVKFATLSVADIKAYVNTGEPMDKAGAYGIQGIGGQMVEEMQGDFFTVMGLPMHSLSKCLAKLLS